MSRAEGGYFFGIAIVLVALALLIDRAAIPEVLAAVLLTLPPAVATLWFTRRQAAKSPFGMILGMAVGTLVRGTIAVAGGALIYFGSMEMMARGVSFWVWLSVAYLSLLTLEVFALAKPGWVGVGAAGRKG